jgi:methyl-accepting chemotaxis protein
VASTLAAQDSERAVAPGRADALTRRVDAERAAASAAASQLVLFGIGDITLSALSALAFSLFALRLVSQGLGREEELTAAVRGLSDRDDLLDRLRSTSAVLGGVADDLRSSARSAATVTSEQSAAVAQTSAAMVELATAAGSIADNVRAVARAEAQTGDTMRDMGEKVAAIAQRALSLGERVRQIGDILGLIDGIAEQTNLLALNAAIIAAQAGEQGKGFAVVADEIKDLAERAGASTREITDLIKTVQAESKNAIAAVERGAHNVDRGVEVSNEAERALKKILESSQKSTNMVRAIARATVEQAKGSKQVTDAIGRIAETVQQIAAATAEQARGSELIMKSAEKMRIITQHVERSSQEQARGGRQISSAIENISNMVNQLNSSHKAQSSGSTQLLVSAAKIEEASAAQQASLKQLMTAIERLKRAAL